MNEKFKEKATQKVKKAILSIETLSKLSYNSEFSHSVIEELFKEIEAAIVTNKEKLLRREKPLAKDKDIIEFEDEEQEGQLSDIPIEKRRVYSDKSDPPIRDLYRSFIEGELILQPEFQRYYVWDDKKATLLVESVLLDVPLPIFYLAEEAQNKFSVIDGQQRLVSLFRFLSPVKLGNQDIEVLKLRGLEVLTNYNGCYFKDLPEELQRKYNTSTLRVIKIGAESHPDVKFEIFQRLNTGAVKLNDQELRNCVYRGKYNVLLKELAEDKDFQGLLGLKAIHPRMVDRELILRFLTFYHNTYLKYSPPMKQFLNKEMQKNLNLSPEDEKEIRVVFKNSVQLAKTVFGPNAFKRFAYGTSNKNPNGQWEKKKINRALFDMIMVGFSKHDKNQIVPKADMIREEFLYLLTHDETFEDSILFTTDKKEKVNYRFTKWLQNLEEIVGLPQTEKRCFSLELKEGLWKSNKACKLCGQRIHELDDAEVDHIQHYWRGGKTIPSNARLVHRYCNRKRGGREFVANNNNESVEPSGVNVTRQNLSHKIKIGKGGKALISEFLKKSNQPLIMQEIVDYMKTQGYTSKTYYDWMNSLIDDGLVVETSKMGKKAYQSKI